MPFLLFLHAKFVWASFEHLSRYVFVMVLISIILPHLSTALEPSPQEQEGGTGCLKWSSTTFVIELKEPNDVDPFSSHFLPHVIALSL